MNHEEIIKKRVKRYLTRGFSVGRISRKLGIPEEMVRIMQRLLESQKMGK